VSKQSPQRPAVKTRHRLLATGDLSKAVTDFRLGALYPFQKLEAGNRILLYTDGIVEAANPSGEFLGHEALCELLQRTAVLQPAEAANRIVSSVQRWSATQDDDLTVLICDYQGVA
jgi:serine/threonine protein phosphatase PrpC